MPMYVKAAHDQITHLVVKAARDQRSGASGAIFSRAPDEELRLVLKEDFLSLLETADCGTSMNVVARY